MDTSTALLTIGAIIVAVICLVIMEKRKRADERLAKASKKTK